ncbi:LysR family transcriptional regulator [Algihabitans albus]|uniref:LysR family transcriptional regulator n=1 Tax=Algihabitans albus TaxID=2164067 RepID=UPI000E5D0025|nr:LysR family transcriptional regulator [Algihabitans albus]
MTISYRQLQAFVAVADLRSFRAAGDRIGLSQPALSLAIKSLEQQLGGPLIDRRARSCELTREGATFYPAAARLLSDWDAAVEDARSLFAMERGRVSAAALPSIAAGYLPAVLSDYLERHPRIDVEIFDVIAGRVLQLVRDGRADFGLSVRPPQGSGVTFELLLRERFVVVHPPGHPIGCGGRTSSAELQDYPFIALSRSSSVRKALDDTLGERLLKLRPVIEVEQLSTAATLVVQGRGLTAVPEACLPLMRVYGLSAVPLEQPEIGREIGVLTRTEGSLSVAAQALLAAARDAIGGTS